MQSAGDDMRLSSVLHVGQNPGSGPSGANFRGIMNMRRSALSLAIIGCAAGLLAPMAAEAGDVGYFNGCELSGNPSGVITTAGHTPVPVATLDAPSLAGLDGLIITACYGSYSGSTAVNDAVNNGMALVFERLDWTGSLELATTTLPGSPTFGSTAQQVRPAWGDQVDIAAGAPTVITSGPGGTLNNASLDYASGPTWYNLVAYFSVGSLPAGAVPFLTTPDQAQVGSFGYTHGAGRVVYSDSQFTLQLPGGYGDLYGHNNFRDAGATYLTNALTWALGEGPSEPVVTCASEGYTGTKLTWCKNICEMGYTGATLDMWIHRWINRYRDLPYCAQEDGEEQPKLRR
jgi:hypothetical protein